MSIEEKEERLELPNLPKIIRNEYDTLFDMLEQREYYGALLQVKDVLEIVLKFQIIVLLSGIEQYISRKDVEVEELRLKYPQALEVLDIILSRDVSFGLWEDIGKRLGTLSFDDLPLNPEHKEILLYFYELNRKIYKGYFHPRLLKRLDGKGGNISTWRNNYIGHGAISSDKEKIKETVLILTAVLNGILADCNYSGIRITVQDNSFVFLNVEESENNINITPFVLPIDYVFENYHAYKSYATLLNYSNGSKQINQELSRRLNFLRNKLNVKLATEETVNEAALWSQDVEELEKLVHKNLVFNHSFYDVFAKGLENKKGIFFIGAERGMGKTTFVKLIADTSLSSLKYLEQLYKVCNFQEDIEIKVWPYYFNSIYACNRKIFWQTLKEQFLIEFKYNENINKQLEEFQSKYFDSSLDRKELAHEFSALLNCVYQEYACKYPDFKMLLIFDGVDEIPQVEGRIEPTELLEEESLNENIYIFILGRTLEECNDLAKYLDYCSASHIISRTDMLYQKSLENFINKYLFVKKTEVLDWSVIKSKLSQVGENRFLYLNMLSRLVEYSPKAFFDALNSSDGLGLVKIFLDSIEAISNKYKNSLYRLLLILNNSQELLSLADLWYLFSNRSASGNSVNYKFLAMLKDIAGFLYIKKDYLRGNLFTISNIYYGEEITKLQDSSTHEALHQELCQAAEGLLMAPEPKGFNGQELLLLAEQLPYLTLSEEKLKRLLELLYQAIQKEQELFCVKRMARIIDHLEDRKIVARLEAEESVKFLYIKCNILTKLGDFQNGLIVAVQAVAAARAKLDEYNPLFIETLFSYSKHLYSCELFEASLALFQELEEKLIKADNPAFKDYLHNVTYYKLENLMLLGRYQELQRLSLQYVKDVKAAYKEDHHIYIMAHEGLALAYDASEEYPKAVELYKEIIRLKAKVYGQEHLECYKSYVDLARSLYRNANYNQSLEYSKKAISFYKQYYGEEHPDTIYAIDTYGQALNALGEYELVIPLRKQLLELRRKVLGEKAFGTIISYCRIGITYSDMNNFEEAYRYSSVAYKYALETLGEEHTVTGTLQSNMLNDMMELHLYEEAAPYIERLKQFTLENENIGTHTRIFNMDTVGMFYSYSGKYAEAEEIFRENLQLSLDHYAKDNTLIGNRYASFMHLYEEMQDYDKAIQAAHQALEEFRKSEAIDCNVEEMEAAIAKLKAKKSNN